MSKNDITPERRAEAALRIAEDRTEESLRFQRERDAARDALRALIRAYVSLMETARERIVGAGGECDSLEVMERDDPYLKKAREALVSNQS